MSRPEANYFEWEFNGFIGMTRSITTVTISCIWEKEFVDQIDRFVPQFPDFLRDFLVVLIFFTTPGFRTNSNAFLRSKSNAPLRMSRKVDRW
jgi:hypothetical protein